MSERSDAKTAIQVLRRWDTRPCWICGNRGICGHREPPVDLAELRALVLAIAREEA